MDDMLRAMNILDGMGIDSFDYDTVNKAFICDSAEVMSEIQGVLDSKNIPSFIKI